MGSVCGKNSGSPILHTQGHLALRHRALLAVVRVHQLSVFTRDFLAIHIGHIYVARSMHPAAVFVKSLVDEKLAPGNSAIGIQSLFTYHVYLGAEVKRDVRIDIQNRLARCRALRGQGKTI